MRRVAAAALILGAAVMAAAKPAKRADPPPDPRAQQAFERTKRAGATYALYSWNWRRGRTGAGVRHWSAEFHRASLHRVETPDVRVVADCAAGTGSWIAVASGRVETSPVVAGAACGINANFPIRQMEWLGTKESRFGTVDLVRIVDPADERIYAVDAAGALLSSQYFARDPKIPDCVQSEPLAYSAELPADDMFSVESLQTSFVAERFRAGPEAPMGDLWISDRRCL